MQNFTVLSPFCELDDGWIRSGWKLLKFYNTHLLKISGWQMSPKASSLQMDGDRRHEIKRRAVNINQAVTNACKSNPGKVYSPFFAALYKSKRSTIVRPKRWQSVKQRDWAKQPSTFDGYSRFEPFPTAQMVKAKSDTWKLRPLWAQDLKSIVSVAILSVVSFVFFCGLPGSGAMLMSRTYKPKCAACGERNFSLLRHHGRCSQEALRNSCQLQNLCLLSSQTALIALMVSGVGNTTDYNLRWNLATAQTQVLKAFLPKLGCMLCQVS